MDINKLKKQYPELVARIQSEARIGMVQHEDAGTAKFAAVSNARNRLCALVVATMGAEVGTKLATIVDKGLNADDVKDLGITLAPTDSAPMDKESRQEILKALHQVAPEPVKGTKFAFGEETERSSIASKIAVGGNCRAARK